MRADNAKLESRDETRNSILEAADGLVDVEVEVESTSGNSESVEESSRVEIDSRVGGVGMTASCEAMTVKDTASLSRR